MAKPTDITCMSLTAETAVFHFKVDGYSLARDIAGVGECFQSSTFTVGCYDWAVRYYPRPQEDDPNPRIGLVLLSKPGGDVGVTFEYRLVDDSGETSTELFSSDARFYSCGQEECSDECLDLEDLDYISEKRVSFVLHCTIAVLKKPFVPRKVQSSEDSP